MYRHVVLRLRADGVHNAVFVMDYMGDQVAAASRGSTDLYPGDDVVDWVSWDPYTCIAGKDCKDFSFLLNKRYSANSPWPGMYNYAVKNFPGKPLMLSEWAAFENGDASRQPNFYNTIAGQLDQFPALKAMVYWDSWRGPRGDTRLSLNKGAAAAMTKLANTSYYKQQMP